MPERRLAKGATYDHRDTGDRFTVESRVAGRRIAEEPTRDPFIHTTVHIGLRDLLRGLLHRRLDVTVVVGGDQQIVEDVLTLDNDYTGLPRSERRREWDAELQGALHRFASDPYERRNG